MAKLANNQQELYCNQYLIDRNQTQAAIRAKYSENSAKQYASELMKRHDILERIAELDAERAERVEIKADYVILGIKEAVERSMQAVPVLDRNGMHVYTTTEDGDMKPAYKFDAMAALKGYELLGKHLGMWVEKHELTGKGGAPLQAPVFNIIGVKANGSKSGD